MLEDRLSSTYSQHNLGAYRSQSIPQAPNMYPHIPSEPPNGQSTGVESYYNMNAPPSHSNGYVVPPQSQYAGHALPQSPYHERERAPSNTSSNQHFGYNQQSQVPQQTSMLHRTPSMAAYGQAPSQSIDSSYVPPAQVHAHPQSYQQYSQPPQVQALSRTPTISSQQDPAASFHVQRSQPTNQEVSPLQQQVYPPQQESSYPPQQVGPPTTGYADQVSQLQTQPQPNTHQQQAPPQQGYWSSQAPSAAQTVQRPPESYSHPQYPYTADNFPSAPQHQPQTVAKEEALIEL